MPLRLKNDSEKIPNRTNLPRLIFAGSKSGSIVCVALHTLGGQEPSSYCMDWPLQGGKDNWHFGAYRKGGKKIAQVDLKLRNVSYQKSQLVLHVHFVLPVITHCAALDRNIFLSFQLLCKIVQRITKIFLPPENSVDLSLISSTSEMLSHMCTLNCVTKDII